MQTNNNQRCKHNKIPRYCLVCDGRGLCIPHNIKKNVCVDCNGSSICVHKRRRFGCKQCKQSGLCKHNVISSNCDKCILKKSNKQKKKDIIEIDANLIKIIPNFGSF